MAFLLAITLRFFGKSNGSRYVSFKNEETGEADGNLLKWLKIKESKQFDQKTRKLVKYENGKLGLDIEFFPMNRGKQGNFGKIYRSVKQRGPFRS